MARYSRFLRSCQGCLGMATAVLSLMTPPNLEITSRQWPISGSANDMRWAAFDDSHAPPSSSPSWLAVIRRFISRIWASTSYAMTGEGLAAAPLLCVLDQLQGFLLAVRARESRRWRRLASKLACLRKELGTRETAAKRNTTEFLCPPAIEHGGQSCLYIGPVDDTELGR